MVDRPELDDEDAIAIGLKIVEMADRLKPMHAVLPGTEATWAFQMDDQRFVVTMTMAPKQEGN